MFTCDCDGYIIDCLTLLLIIVNQTQITGVNLFIIMRLDFNIVFDNNLKFQVFDYKF